MTFLQPSPPVFSRNAIPGAKKIPFLSYGVESGCGVLPAVESRSAFGDLLFAETEQPPRILVFRRTADRPPKGVSGLAIFFLSHQCLRQHIGDLRIYRSGPR